MKKKLCSLLLAVCTLFSLTACGNSSGSASSAGSAASGGSSSSSDAIVTLSKPITIQFWSCIDNEVYAADVKEVIDSFNSTVGADMGITVDCTTYAGIEPLETATVAAIKSGSVPNVVLTEATYVTDYMDANAVVDLTPYIEDGKWGLDLSDYYDCFINDSRNYAQPGYYSLPSHVSGEVMYYNKDFFDKNGLTVPTTWDEMEATARKASAIIGGPAFGWDDPLKMFTTLTTQAGAGYADSTGKILFGGDNLQTAIDTVSWYKGLVNEGIFRTPGEDYYFSGPFANQKIPMYIGSGNEGAYIDMKIDPNNSFTWSCAPIPQGKTGWSGKSADYSEGYLMSMLDMKNDLEARFASWVFMQYWESADSVMNYTGSGSFLPYLKSVANSSQWQALASPAQLAGIQQMDAFYTYPGFETPTYNASTLRSESTLAMQNILDNNADVKDTLTNLAGEFSN